MKEKANYCSILLSELLVELAESHNTKIYNKCFEKLYNYVLSYLEDRFEGEFTRNFVDYDGFPSKRRNHGGAYGLKISLEVGTEEIMEKSDSLTSNCTVFIPPEELSFVIYEMERSGVEATVESVRIQLLNDPENIERIEKKIFAIFREKLERIGKNCDGFQILYELLDNPVEEIVNDLEICYEVSYENLDKRIKELI